MAVQDPTTNYAWNIPNDLGDDGAWGALLRTIIGDDVTGIDAVLYAVSVVADAALSRAGGTMTGALAMLTSSHTAVNLGNMSGTVTLNLATGNAFYGTLTATSTIAFSNVPASGRAVSVVLEITDAGADTINWPASVDWPGGSPPTMTGRCIVVLYTRDGGTTWSAALSHRNLS